MSSILNSNVPEIGVDVLKPTKYIKLKPAEVRENMTSWYDWLVSHNPENIRRPVSDAYKEMKDRVMYLFKESKPRGSIEINGEKLTAKQALTRYPQLRELLQGKRKISEKSLESKLRTWAKNGKIPNEIFDPEPEIVPRGRLLGGNVMGQYTIHSKVRNTLKFKNLQNMVECPIKIMLDFESFLEKSDKVSGKTELYQVHKPSAFCIYVVSRVDGFEMDPITYVCEDENDDVGKVFTEELERITKGIYERFKESKAMIFDEEAKKLHDSQNECYACGERFDNKSKEYCKVRDHCHYTGKYRGALHSKCNLKLKRTRTIPVFAHNLSGYDSHCS